MKRLLLAAMMAGGLIPGVAAAQPTALWKTVGPWQLRVDSSVGEGCFMMTEFQGGTVLRIGVDPRLHQSYLWLGNPAWRSLETGKQYTLALAFDDGPPQPWQAIAVNKPSLPGTLIMHFTNAAFWSAFAVKTSISFGYQGAPIARLSLAGTVAAVQSLVDCQRQFNAMTTRSAPPPAVPARGDPFAG